MPRTASPRHFRPKDACTFDFEGEPVVLNPNQIFDANDPLVRGRPELFKPLEATRQRPRVEQMTAAPGERRGGSVFLHAPPGRPCWVAGGATSCEGRPVMRAMIIAGPRGVR